MQAARLMLIAGILVLATATSAVAQGGIADAAMRGDRAAVSAFLAQGADVNAPQADGTTALHWAAYRSDVEMARMLIAAGASATANHYGSTPMWLAATNGDASMLAEFIGAGADPNEVLPMGRTPLMIAARTGDLEAMRILLDRGADVNARDSERGTTPLMWAADQGHAAAAALLIEYGADIAAHSDPAQRGRGPALGKSNDPRNAVRRQVADVIAELQARALLSPEEQARAEAEAAAAAAAAQDAAAAGVVPDDAAAAAALGFGGVSGGGPSADGGQLTPLVYAARANSLETVRTLLEAGADVNQVTGYGWSPLLVATQNRHYLLGKYLMENGADVNLANNGGWTPLYLATDNRNIENGDYPVRQPDMDHLEFIKLLLAEGADTNARMIDSTETRTVFTNQWLDEEGATAFLRASQSGDLELMRLLLEHGADPHIATELNVTALQVAAGIGWVEGVTTEWSTDLTVEAVKLLLELGVDPNIQADTGRTALHGAAHKGSTEVARLLIEHGADMNVRDYGNTDNRGSPELAAHTWRAIDYADGLVRVGVQSSIAHPETAALIRQHMEAAGLDVPPVNRTLDSICIVEVCSIDYNP